MRDSAQPPGLKMFTGKTKAALLAGGVLIAVLLPVARTQTNQPESVRLIQSIQGPALYAAYCGACHGKDGKGEGPVAKSLKVAPPDLTRIARRNGGSFPATRIRQIISGDDALAAGHGTREMPLWGDIFSQIAWDQDLGKLRVYNLAKYLEGLQTK